MSKISTGSTPSDPKRRGRPADAVDDVFVDEAVTSRYVVQHVMELAIEIAREGREGRRIGTLFTVGDHQAVLALSRCLILDPLAGHPAEHRRVDDLNLRETLKELAQLDGGFVISGDGHAVSGARYFEAGLPQSETPLGLGSRHIAAASITRHTSALAVVVSEGSVVRVFRGGVLDAEILPEVWLLRRYIPHLLATRSVERLADKVVAAAAEPDQVTTRQAPGFGGFNALDELRFAGENLPH